MNIPIAYEDDWLVVLNKPPGLLTIPTPKHELRTLTSIMNDDLKKKGVPFRLHPCHRLDKETSGVIIYAKGKSMQKRMAKEFQKKSVKKVYIAFVHGALSQDEGEMRYPIEGREAVTRYKVIARKKGFSIIEAMPLTGRTNQIRLHCKYVGHPVVGETKFAFRRDFSLRAKRLCLHAKSVQFIHPMTGRAIYVEASLADDLNRFLQKYAA